MTRAKVGERVGVLRGMMKDGKSVGVFGFGERLKDEIPCKGVYFVGVDLHERGVPVPTLLLDNGDKVYGCECWWGSESHVKDVIKNHDIVECSIEDYRKENIESMKKYGIEP